MPKTITLEGRKYTPKWDWSKEYAAHVRADLRIPPKSAEDIAEQYARWLAEREDVPVPSSAEARFVWDADGGTKYISAVRFGTIGSERVQYGPRARQWRNERRFFEVAAIGIPNANPVVAHAWAEVSCEDDASVAA